MKKGRERKGRNEEKKKRKRRYGMEEQPNFYDKFDKKKKGREISPYIRVRTRARVNSKVALWI